MSKLETPMTRWYWQQIGGTLIEEFCAVQASDGCGPRRIDGVIIMDGEYRVAKQQEVSLEGRDVVIVQAKAKRLGMSVMGQAYFSAQIVQRFKPKSVESIALVTADDVTLRPLLEQYPGMRVVIYPRQA